MEILVLLVVEAAGTTVPIETVGAEGGGFGEGEGDGFGCGDGVGPGCWQLAADVISN